MARTYSVDPWNARIWFLTTLDTINFSPPTKMNREVKSTLGLVLAIVWTDLCFSNEAELIHYASEYRGLVTGRSTQEETIKTLGPVERVDKTSNGENLHFAKVIVNFSSPDPRTINTVIIFLDREFTTRSGVSIGYPVSRLKEKIPHLEGEKNVYVDMQEGIVFWTNGIEVQRIVLTRALVRLKSS